MLLFIDHGGWRWWRDRLIARIYLPFSAYHFESGGTGFGSEESTEQILNKQLHHLRILAFALTHLRKIADCQVLLSPIPCPKTTQMAERNELTNAGSAQNSDLNLKRLPSSQHCCAVDHSAMIGRKKKTHQPTVATTRCKLNSTSGADIHCTSGRAICAIDSMMRDDDRGRSLMDTHTHASTAGKDALEIHSFCEIDQLEMRKPPAQIALTCQLTEPNPAQFMTRNS